MGYLAVTDALNEFINPGEKAPPLQVDGQLRILVGDGDAHQVTRLVYQKVDGLGGIRYWGDENERK